MWAAGARLDSSHSAARRAGRSLNNGRPVVVAAAVAAAGAAEVGASLFWV
jgi:hypothetical protein